jgi:pyruvate/2-oxoacid:ferredoxin oxidoreductase beta subunit
MGFLKPDISTAYSAIRKSLVEIHSPYNDGWTGSSCKQELYQLKCWLEDEYCKLPTFTGEEKWEQERVVEILKR